MNEKYFSVEQKIVALMIKFGIFGTIVGGISNFLQRPVFLNFLMPSIMIVFLLYISFIIKKEELFKIAEKTIIIFLNFIFTPVMWFLTGGSKSAFPMYIFSYLLTSLIILKKKEIIVFIASFSFMISALILSEIFVPELFLGYSSEVSRAADYIISIIFVSVYLSLNINILKKTYETEREIAKKLSETDDLSGLHNRRHFLSEYYRIISSKNFRNFSVLMLDIDNFKKVNDIYGHIEGDRIIKYLGDALKMNISDEDLAGRYGGDEFILLIFGKPDETLKKARIIKEEFLNFARIFDEAENLSLSIGIAHADPDNTDIIKTADDKLIEAKNEGKNRIK